MPAPRRPSPGVTTSHLALGRWIDGGQVWLSSRQIRTVNTTQALSTPSVQVARSKTTPSASWGFERDLVGVEQQSSQDTVDVDRHLRGRQEFLEPRKSSAVSFLSSRRRVLNTVMPTFGVSGWPSGTKTGSKMAQREAFDVGKLAVAEDIHLRRQTFEVHLSLGVNRWRPGFHQTGRQRQLRQPRAPVVGSMAWMPFQLAAISVNVCSTRAESEELTIIATSPVAIARSARRHGVWPQPWRRLDVGRTSPCLADVSDQKDEAVAAQLGPLPTGDTEYIASTISGSVAATTMLGAGSRCRYCLTCRSSSRLVPQDRCSAPPAGMAD